MPFDPKPFDVLQGLISYGIVAGIVIAAILIVGLLVCLIKHRGRALLVFTSQTGTLFRGALQTSPRRVWAVSVLTFREAIRKKVLLIFVVFAILFMFAGWFLSANNARADLQVEVHVSFVLKTISLLAIVVMLLLACWGLPADIKARSVHTVVTKPVRRQEVYLGRIIGFSIVGTLVVAVMGVVGYFWIVRQVPQESHSHLTCRVPVYGTLGFLDNDGNPKDKGINVGDIWEFRSYIGGGPTKAAAIWTFDNVSKSWLVDGKNRTTGEPLIDPKTEEPLKAIRIETGFEVFRTYKGDQKRGVRCEVKLVKDLRTQAARALGSTVKFREVRNEVETSNFEAVAVQLEKQANGLRQGKQGLNLVAREYGEVEQGYNDFAALLIALRDGGNDAAWIPELAQNAERAAAAAKDQNATALADALDSIAKPMRANKDEIKDVLIDMVASVDKFEVQEYRGGIEIDIPVRLKYRINGKGKLIQDGDLFEDFMVGNKLSVHVVCLDRNQFLGMARPDLFIRLPNRHFAVGYSKAIFGVWLAVLLVIVLSVTGSTFLKGPVGTLLVVVLLILGSAFHGFMQKIVEGDVESAGAFESAYRLINHHNPSANIDQRRGVGTLRRIDTFFTGVLTSANLVVPDLSNFRMYPFVARGFDVPFSAAILEAILTTIAFFSLCFIIGYLSLALRELEDK